MYRKIIISIFWCSIVVSLSTYGQGASANPFEIQSRLPTIEVDPLSINDTGNPFDISRSAAKEEATQVVTPSRRVSTAKNISDITRRLRLITATILLLLLTILVTIFRSQLSRTYRAFLNDNMLSQLQRERETIGGIPYYLFYTFFMLSAGFFLFLVANYYGYTMVPDKPWRSLGICVLIVPIFFIVKHFILIILAYIFPIKKEMTLYSLTMIVFGIVLGLFLLPANLLLAFAPENTNYFIIYGTLFVMASIYIFRTLRGLFIANKFLLFHKFHFLLYICTVEIAPIAILVKLLLA